MKFTARIAVFGGRDISSDLHDETVDLGKLLARRNYLVFCGGGPGVMEAIAKGVSEESGTVVGILKDENIDNGNGFLTIPIATSLGIGRNSLIAYNCDVALAIGGHYGTLSEIAYALQLNKPVIGYKSWVIPGMDQAQSLDEILEKIGGYLLPK